MPDKRVVDIYTPQKKEKQEEPVLKEEKQEEAKMHIRKFKPSLPAVPVKGNKWIKIGGAIVFVLILAVLFFKLPKAEIVIWPETEEFDMTFKVTVNEDASSVNLASGVIPGVMFEVERQITDNFLATGQATKEGKAKGLITVYNEYSTEDQILIATTRFISTDGKLFRSSKKVVVPGGHYEGGTLVPGQIEIEVVADEPGPEYNIEPTTFSIPGFAGTARYTKFYAKSFSSMTGGFLSGAKLVTANDLEGAKTEVSKKAKEDAQAQLRVELGSESKAAFIYLENAIQTEIVETFSLATEGKEAENFNFQAKAKSKTLIFRKSDLEEFIKEYVVSKAKTGSKVYEPTMEISYAPETISLNTGKIDLVLKVKATSYIDIDVNKLKQVVSGKSLTGSKVFLENQAGVTAAQVDFWPFWVKSAPGDLDKIKVELEID